MTLSNSCFCFSWRASFSIISSIFCCNVLVGVSSFAIYIVLGDVSMLFACVNVDEDDMDKVDEEEDDDDEVDVDVSVGAC